ncbi:hypothetical protein [Chitinophaga arvensicola]|uniref:Cthe-2314-like HEPN domain-containing protein n=1 Tax=Chitinophaga arvensicola TaxID=29529 RepID=A0A1I0S7F6_9BACT|nr:hypothetical protein [Chitinophaga arvensicola]SEW51616.1 hypothetical protein SAMN04488122_4377 [Chitinophaga arvensicola]
MNSIILENKSSQFLNNETEEGILFFTEMLDKLHQLVDSDPAFSDAKEKLSQGYTLQYEINLLYQVSALATISILDMMTICRGFNNALNIDWLRIFYAKQGYLTIHETITHYDKEYNKALNELITIHHPLLISDFRAFTDKLKRFKVSYNARLISVRNKIAGHIHVNFNDYYSTVTDLKKEDPIAIISTFLEILIQLQQFTTKILPESIDKYKTQI